MLRNNQLHPAAPLVAGCLCIVALFSFTLLVHGLGQASYWLDELYSVTVSGFDWQHWRTAMLADVHPPLYQLILKGWIAVFGDSELATRMFSTLCMVAAILLLLSQRRWIGDRACFVTLLLVLANWLTYYYGMETRSYALLFFAALLAATQFIRDQSGWPQFVGTLLCCLLLGLIHFFGLIVAGLMLAWLFFQNLRQPARLLLIVLASALVLAWPLMMILSGGLGEKAGGSSWIESTGPVTALQFAAKAVLPQVYYPLEIIFSKNLWAGLLATLVAFSGMALLLKHSEHLGPSHPGLGRLTLVCYGSVLTILAIELHTPISSTRYFMAVIAPIYLLFGLRLNDRHWSPGIWRKLTAAALVLFVLLGAAQTLLQLRDKYRGFEARREVAGAIIEQKELKGAFYLSESNTPLPPPDLGHVLRNFYYQQISDGEFSIEPVNAERLRSLETPFAIVYGRYSNAKRQHLQSLLPAKSIEDIRPAHWSEFGYFVVTE